MDAITEFGYCGPFRLVDDGSLEWNVVDASGKRVCTLGHIEQHLVDTMLARMNRPLTEESPNVS